MPSRTHIIFPQLRQLGAAERRGWRVALQVQVRDFVSFVEEEVEGLVWISRARIAASCSFVSEDSRGKVG